MNSGANTTESLQDSSGTNLAPSQTTDMKTHIRVTNENRERKEQGIQMGINKRIFFIVFLFSLIIISCQTKEFINSTKYENLTSEKKKEIDEYISDAKKMISKKDNEIVLMFQYNCFFGNIVTINNTYTKDFPKDPTIIHYGQKIVNYNKDLGKIKIKLSNEKNFSISQKTGYDYITICYNEKSEIIYIHYYDYPKILIEE